MIALEFSGGFEVFAPYSPISPFKLGLGLCAILAVLQIARRRAAIAWLPLLAMCGYLVAVTISFLASRLSPSVTSSGVSEALNLVVFTAVISILAVNITRWQWIAAAITVPMAAISLLAVINQFVLGNTQSFLGFEQVTTYLGVGSVTARHAGPLLDPNFWGRLLATGLPLSLALVHYAWTRVSRGVAAVAAISPVLLLAGIYLTSSRGAYLAAAFGVVVYGVVAGMTLNRLLIAAPIGALLLLIPGVGSRLFSFGGGQLAAEDGSFLSRLATQRVALAMVHDRPLVGVGPDGYLTAFGEYAAEAQQSLEMALAAHNLYLGLWAEIGLLGLVAFCALLLVGLIMAGRSALTARRMPTTAGDHYRPYAAGLFAGLMGWCVASVFLHLSYARIAILLVCLSAALWHQVRRVPLTASADDRRSILVGSGAVIGALVAVVVVALIPQGTEVTATGRVVPAFQKDAYLISLRTRSVVIPSLAVVINQVAPSPVDAQGDMSAGVVRVTAVGATEDQARERLFGALDAGSQAIKDADLATVFSIVWDGEDQVAKSRASLVQLASAGAMGGLAGAGVALIGAKVIRRRPGGGPGTRGRGIGGQQ